MKRVMMKRMSALLMAIMLIVGNVFYGTGLSVKAADTSQQVIAFPGAEGGGKYATGGRGGNVYIVTNLQDYALGETPVPGSLRYGIEQATTDGSTIVFNVGGTINLKQTLGFSGKKNITIAGQTAPGDGITIAGFDTNISNSENLIIRFIRFRPGASNVFNGGDSMDALWGRDNKTFIIDHCSFSWNTDECLSTYRGVDGTVQWCIVSESLTVSGHSKGRHGYGGIFGGDNVVFQYNLIADHTSRNPRIGGGSLTDPTKIFSTATLQVSNNVLYNWGYFGCYGGGYAYTNYMNNYLKAGPGTRDAVVNRIVDAGESGKVGGFYVNGNYVEGNAAISADNSLGVKFAGDATGTSATTIASTPYTAVGFSGISLISAQNSYQAVLNKAGATFPKRDAVDARVVSDTINNTGRFINTEDEVGGYPAVAASRDSAFDTDADGIADYWEAAHGLSVTDATDSKVVCSDGYTNLEHYINSLVTGVTSADYVAPNPTVKLSLANNAQYSEGQNVEVSATAVANNGGTITKVEFYNGSTIVGTDTQTPYTCTYSGLTDGTYNITARAYDNDGNETQSSLSKLYINSTAGTGSWTSKDIGTPGVAGSASLTNDVLTVKGAGKIGKSEGSVSGGALSDATKDNFQFTYQTMTGDGELTTKLDYVNLVDNHTFSGLMFRDSLDNNAKTAAVGMSLVKINASSTWSTYLVSRSATGGTINEISETIDTKANATSAGISIITDLNFKTGKTYNGTWLKLARHGDVFTAYSSQDGATWTEVGSRTISMGSTIYIGFAVDANKVANDIDNLSTAKFSNININQDFKAIKFNLTNLTATGAGSVQTGSSYSATLTPATGFALPESVTVTMGGLATTAFTYDKTTGSVTIPSVTGDVVITATGPVLNIVGDYSPVEVDPDNLLTVSADGSIMRLVQSATSGKMTQTMATPGTNISYLLFPQTNEVQTMSLNLKIKNYSIFGADGKYTGLFVGAFQTSNNYLFASLGFRGYNSSVGTDSLSGYWIKTSGSAGNGSPKYSVGVNDEYKVTFTKNDSGYYASFEDLTNPILVSATGDKKYSDVKQFKLSEMKLTAADAVQYGLALVGVSVDVTNLKLQDKNGNVLYNQADYYKDAGTAPTVTSVATPTISEDRSAVNVSWSGQGATGDGKYQVEVSNDGGTTFKVLGTTVDTTYSYSAKATGNYIFRVSGICGTSTTAGVNSASVKFVLPMVSPVINGSSGNGQNTISWSAVNEATSYVVYRSTSRNGDYTIVGTTSQLSYVDTTAVNEVPYFYKVTASSTDNTSNPSSAITIMATAGHTGEYVFGSQAAQITVLEKTNDTVTSGNASIKFSSSVDGTFKVSVNNSIIDTKTVTANTPLAETISLADGRNDVVLNFTDGSGKTTYKNLNFVKLTKIDIIVDSSYSGGNTENIPIFKTVKDAIASVPADNATEKVIFIKNGTYYEKVDVNSPNITLIGEDSEKTILCYDAAAGTTVPGTSGTYGTSGSSSITVNPTAIAFCAENLTIANTFDFPHSSIDGKQAVAFYNKADQSILTNVRMLGYQDTLCADGNARQYYSKCYIEGNVDYIFGNAQAVFEDCDIVSNGGGYVTAASTESIKATGYVFINSRILAKDTSVQDASVYLGRPWRANACVMYINCFLDRQIVSDKGYTDMSGNSYKNAQYFEFGSYGPGFAVNTNRPQLSKEQAAALSVNGVFAREAGTGLTYASAWDASASYVALSTSYIAVNNNPADYSAVDQAITKANALIPTDFKDFSGVTSAMNAVIRDLKITSQSEVDAMANAILAAINALDRIVIVDTNASAKVEDDNNYIPDNAKLTVEGISSGDSYVKAEEMIKKLENGTQQFAVFEINLTDVSNSAISKLDGTVKVSLPIPAGFDLSKSINVFRVEVDGSLTKLNTQVINGFCVFETNHFSTYIIAESANTGNTDNSGSTDTGNDTNSNTGNDSSSTGAGNDSSNSASTGTNVQTTPATGDFRPTLIYVLFFGSSIGMLISIRKRNWKLLKK